MVAFTRMSGLAAVFLIAVMMPRAVAGQAVTALTGSITGTVKDDSGAVMPGVTVVIASPSQMGSRETVTSREGQFRFAAVAPGEYTLTFAPPGFTSVRFEGVRVTAGFTATLDTSLRAAGVQEQITVSGRAPVVTWRPRK